MAGISCFEDGSLWDEQPEALFTFATGMKQYGSGARSGRSTDQRLADIFLVRFLSR